MTCRHNDDDPTCSSYESKIRRARDLIAKASGQTPDSEKFEIEDVVVVNGKHLVMRVLYPNCAKCSYEGVKVMVFRNCSTLDALRWRSIDPHFRDPSGTPKDPKKAPSPAARFPACDDGWEDALSYARGLT